MSNNQSPDEPPLQTWADALEAAAVGTRFDRIRVLAETASTQDAAGRLAGNRAGLVVIAGRQTTGRGRHGRKWADTAGLGLAMTFAVDGAIDDRTLALAGGLAALGAAEGALGNPSPSPLGLKWPNDVIQRPAPGAGAPVSGGAAGAASRKLAGVLVERRAELALIGIGINVRQGPADWPPDLAARGVSLRMLGSAASRLDVARRLLGHLDQTLRLETAQLTAAWDASEVLTATAGEPSEPYRPGV